MKRLIRVALVIVACPLLATAQQPAATPSFEAAAIKRNPSGETGARFEAPPGRLNAINVPLRFLIRQAYGIPESRILGGPAWLDTDRFHIVAATPGSVNTDAVRGMLRVLLAERFGLVMHTEMREMPIYVLRVARADGTLGPNLRRSSTDCTGRSSAMANGRVQCGILVSQDPGSDSLRGGAATIESFARLLADFLERPLNDETGLTGTFDLELQFSAPRSSSPGAVVPGGLTTSTSPEDIPTVFTALQEQLGLTLQSDTAPVDVVVINAASPPSEN